MGVETRYQDTNIHIKRHTWWMETKSNKLHSTTVLRITITEAWKRWSEAESESEDIIFFGVVLGFLGGYVCVAEKRYW